MLGYVRPLIVLLSLGMEIAQNLLHLDEKQTPSETANLPFEVEERLEKFMAGITSPAKLA